MNIDYESFSNITPDVTPRELWLYDERDYFLINIDKLGLDPRPDTVLVLVCS